MILIVNKIYKQCTVNYYKLKPIYVCHAIKQHTTNYRLVLRQNATTYKNKHIMKLLRTAVLLRRGALYNINLNNRHFK